MLLIRAERGIKMDVLRPGGIFTDMKANHWIFTLIILLTLSQCKNRSHTTSQTTAQKFWYKADLTDSLSLTPRTDFLSYESEEFARFANPKQSRHFLNLNGFWKVALYPANGEFPESEINTDREQWKDINVPSCLELKGFAAPIYKRNGLAYQNQSNILNDPDNFVAVYQRNFQLDQNWLDRHTILHVMGVSGAYRVVVNGQFAGYFTDNRSSAQFDISGHVKKGYNEIVVQVMRWSASSKYEAYDSWSFSGIYDDIYLSSRPRHRIIDFFVNADFDHLKNQGHLQLEIMTENQTGELVEVSVRLEKNGRINTVLDPQSFKAGTRLMFNKVIDSVGGWTSESPILYDMMISLKDRHGEILEYINYPIGFRRVRAIDRSIQINGAKATLKGTQRHRFHPLHGLTTEKSWIESDAELMSLYHMNAVRHEHTMELDWYRQCDKRGIYVVESPNFYMNGELDKVDIKHYMFRLRTALGRFKNHTSRIMIDLDQAKYKTVYQAAKKEIQSKDYPILIGAEEDLCEECDVLISSGALRGNTGDLPMVHRNYHDNLGNAFGGQHESWQEVSASEGFSGGFSGAWIDQTIMLQNSHGQYLWGLGGDMKEGWQRSDSFQCERGLLYANKIKKPAIGEIISMYSPIQIRAIRPETGEFELINNRSFGNTKDITVTWFISGNGQRFGQGAVEKMIIPPGGRERFKIKWNDFKSDPGVQYFISLQITQMINNAGVVKFVDMSSGQYEIIKEKASRPIDQSLFSDLDITVTDTVVRVVTERCTYGLNRKNGLLSELIVGGENWLVEPVYPMFWRAPTSGDYANGQAGAVFSGAKWAVNKLENNTNKRLFVFKVKGKYDGQNLNLEYRIHPSGDIKLEMQTSDFNENWDRFGLIFKLQPIFKSCSWMGRGPGENYPDRHQGSVVERHSGSIWEMTDAYARVQEAGNRSRCRWVNLSTIDQQKLFLMGEENLNFNVMAFDYRHLYPKPGKHLHEPDIVPGPVVSLIIDSYQRGISGPSASEIKNRYFSMRFKPLLRLEDKAENESLKSL